jgi:hypothetical protein
MSAVEQAVMENTLAAEAMGLHGVEHGDGAGPPLAMEGCRAVTAGRLPRVGAGVPFHIAELLPVPNMERLLDAA